MTTKFGFEKSKGLWDDYLGEWIIIFPQGQNTGFSGWCMGIKEGYAILSPFNGGRSNNGRLEGVLVEEGISTVPLAGSVIQPTDRESVLAYIASANGYRKP
ncbi:MAG: hypothetical protein Q8P81_01805 [Nanoarchaeota archaeon]|nr:hypothetical protein [Nanoarchaeota archaeon]